MHVGVLLTMASIPAIRLNIVWKSATVVWCNNRKNIFRVSDKNDVVPFASNGWQEIIGWWADETLKAADKEKKASVSDPLTR